MNLLHQKYPNEIINQLKTKKYLYLKLGSVEMNVCGHENNIDHLPSQFPPDQLVKTKNSIDQYVRKNAGFYFKQPYKDKYDATNSRDAFSIFITLYVNAMLKADCNFLYQFHVNDYKRLFHRNLHRFKSLVFEEEIGIYLELFEYYTTVLNKKILIVSSMIDTMKVQINKMKKLFPNYNIKVENIIFYKSFNTIEGNATHSNWYESFCIMRDEIKKQKFDYCFLGCGSYGPPLADFIYSEMDCSSFSIGATIQLLFGITGKRWESRLRHDKYFYCKYRNEHWIKPLQHEIPKNHKDVEDGCYW